MLLLLTEFIDELKVLALKQLLTDFLEGGGGHELSLSFSFSLNSSFLFLELFKWESILLFIEEFLDFFSFSFSFSFFLKLKGKLFPAQ